MSYGDAKSTSTITSKARAFDGTIHAPGSGTLLVLARKAYLDLLFAKNLMKNERKIRSLASPVGTEQVLKWPVLGAQKAYLDLLFAKNLMNERKISGYSI